MSINATSQDNASGTDDEEVELVNIPDGPDMDKVDCDSDEDLVSAMGYRKTWKNVCVLAVVFICLFMAYNGLVDLQSSLFVDEGMGVMTQSVVYVSFSVSCLFFPKFIISKVGHKWTVTMSMTGYILWMAANGYATWVTMTFTSILVGLCAAPLWTAQTTYITSVAETYARSKKKPITPTVALFFGVFNALFQIAAFCGNVISWAILKHGQRDGTVRMSENDLLGCGANDCAGRNSTKSNVHYAKVPDATLWSLVAVYLLIAIIGLLISIFFLDDLRRGRKRSMKTVSLKDSVWDAIRHHKDVRHLLLIPMAISNGMETVFIWADFNKSYVTCAIGVWMVGLVFLPNVTSNCVASLSVGKLSTYIPRPIFMVTAFLINVVVLCFLLFWRPNPDQMSIFFLVPGLMGLAAGITHVTLNSLIAVTFADKETAFAAIRIWGALGAATGFGMNKFLCVRHKIYINCVGLTIWLTCYVILETIIQRRKSRSKRYQ